LDQRIVVYADNNYTIGVLNKFFYRPSRIQNGRCCDSSQFFQDLSVLDNNR